MAIEILMPALSPTMEEGKIAKWVKKEGDAVAPGDVLAEIETDKAIMEYEAVDEGVLGKILAQAGDAKVKVNSPIAILLEDGEDKSVLSDFVSKSKANNPASSPSDNVTPNKQETLEQSPAKTSSQIIDKQDSFAEPSFENASEKTVREALNEALAEEMRRDENVLLLGEEVAEYQGAYKVTQGLLQEFGARRVIDTPITEMGFAGVGVGASFSGLRAVVEFMTFNFSMQAIDQVVNSAAKTHYMSGGQIICPMVFRGPNGAASRVAAQHSQCYAAWYSHIPGLKVVMPYNASDAKGLLKAAIRDNNPVIFLENELLYNDKFLVPDVDDLVIPLGKARLHKAGKDATIVSFGMGMKYVDHALPKLAELGLDVEVIDLRTIRPMDLPMVIESVKKTGRLVTVEEGFPQSSVGDYIANKVTQAAFDYLDAPVLTITGKDVPMPYAANLEKLALPSVDEIIEAIKQVTYTS